MLTSYINQMDEKLGKKNQKQIKKSEWDLELVNGRK